MTKAVIHKKCLDSDEDEETLDDEEEEEAVEDDEDEEDIGIIDPLHKFSQVSLFLLHFFSPLFPLLSHVLQLNK